MNIYNMKNYNSTNNKNYFVRMLPSGKPLKLKKPQPEINFCPQFASALQKRVYSAIQNKSNDQKNLSILIIETLQQNDQKSAVMLLNSGFALSSPDIKALVSLITTSENASSVLNGGKKSRLDNECKDYLQKLVAKGKIELMSDEQINKYEKWANELSNFSGKI